MSDHERHGWRTLIYSAWHRVASLRDLIGPVRAATLTMIDIDSVEACCRCKEPVAVIETARRTMPKDAPITAALARLAGIPAYSVAYQIDREPEGCAICGKPDETGVHITGFAVQQIAPSRGEYSSMAPAVYAKWLLSLRDGHRCEVNR